MWVSMGDEDHLELIDQYLKYAGGFRCAAAYDGSREGRGARDPMCHRDRDGSVTRSNCCFYCVCRVVAWPRVTDCAGHGSGGRRRCGLVPYMPPPFF